ncbi:MAG TPA: hypothetical protein VI997_09910, partial [Candidatus Thermoplasmatota archaeon]|nr:hypothetical protein [Candidatus Thermoplasmatota archaeon]
MNIATAICISVSLLASAGCLGSAAPAGSESETAQPTAPAVERNDPAPTSTGASPAPRPATWTAANWSGFMTVGAAFEGPDHVEETGGATRPVWSTSFHYEVVDVPEAMEVRLDWDAAVGQIMFMVIVPGNA